MSTAIITANLPSTWTLLQRVFKLGSFHAKYGKSSGQRTGGATARFGSRYGNLSIVTRDERRTRRATTHETGLSISESQEQITSENNTPLKINQKNEIVITTEALDSEARLTSSPQPTSDGGNRSAANDIELGIITKVYHGV